MAGRADQQARHEHQVEHDGGSPIGVGPEQVAQLLLIESASDQSQPDHVDREEGDERTEV